jgi:hypothetical protein
VGGFEYFLPALCGDFIGRGDPDLVDGKRPPFWRSHESVKYPGSASLESCDERLQFWAWFVITNLI